MKLGYAFIDNLPDFRLERTALTCLFVNDEVLDSFEARVLHRLIELYGHSDLLSDHARNFTELLFESPISLQSEASLKVMT